MKIQIPGLYIHRVLSILIIFAAPAHAVVLEEVVVTAQKKTETLQKTPAAITALGGDTMVAAGISDIRDAQMLIPSVRFQAENASTEIYVRGVGSTLDLPQIEPPTAFNFNGIYIVREGTSVPFFDVDQLELLPGPQGTLYGRSALGGTVNVTFNRPVLDQEETKAILGIGNYSAINGNYTRNQPLSDNLAARVSVNYSYNNGYMETGADSKDVLAGRLSFLYEPNDDVNIYLWGYGVHKDGNSPNLVNKGFDPATGAFEENAFLHDDPWNDTRTGALAPLAPFGPPAAEDKDYENYMIGGELEWDLGNMMLTYIPSYFYLDWLNEYWIGALPAELGSKHKQYTSELRLSGENNRLEWLAGFYAYRLESSGIFNIAGASVQAVDDHTLQGVAFFGQATYSITDVFRLTFGGRFSLDDREGLGRASDAFGQPTIPFDYQDDFDSFDWKVGLEYDLQDDIMLYANVETGYQPGTFNPFPNTPTVSNAVDKADLTAFSGGIKSRFLDSTLQINNEFFYYIYKDLFAQSFNASIGRVATFNAERIEIYGNQLDVLFSPTVNDRFNISVGYLHARNDRFVLPGTGGANLNGLQLQYAPDWTVTAGYQHDFHFGGGYGYLRARVDTRFEDRFFGDFFHTPGTRQESYFKTDASLTYHTANERWTIALWVKNIENEAVLAATAAAGIPGPASPFLEAPRTYGLRFTYSN